jgi:predicted O-methyltransferase YrrM
MERTPEAYQRAFDIERAHEYPVIDALEARLGFAVDRDRLEAAARVLACPLKKNPPSWQHGRVLYALARSYLAGGGDRRVWVDVGTAKGFSALCMAWAVDDDGSIDKPYVISFDIINPESRESRNSVEDGKTIEEFVEPFIPDLPVVDFFHGHVATWAKAVQCPRIGFAFIDGSHTYEGVTADIEAVSPRQRSGDIMLFDDVHIEAVRRAVEETFGYVFEIITVLPKRQYCIAVKQ